MKMRFEINYLNEFLFYTKNSLFSFHSPSVLTLPAFFFNHFTSAEA